MQLDRRFWRAFFLACAFLLAACRAPSPLQGAGAVAPSLTLDAATLVDALAKKPNTNWQDGLLTYPPLTAARKAHYHVQAPGTGSIVGSYNAGVAVSSAPAYARAGDVWYMGPSPYAGDRLYAIGDAGTLYQLNPSNMTAPPVTKAGLGSFSKSAVVVSGDNRRAYLLSTSGNFLVVDLTSPALNVLYNQKISTSGFAGSAPYLDYGTNMSGGSSPFGTIENLFATASDGSIYRVHIDASNGNPSMAVSVNACPSSNGTDKASPQPSWATNAQIPYGAALTVRSFAVAWMNQVFFGTAGGKFYQVDMSNPTAPGVRSWNLAAYTSAQGTAHDITAAPAIDFDNSFNVSAIFVPCGDRLNWIDPATGAVTTSHSLALDRVPPVGNAGALTSYAPLSTSLNAYQAADWISIKKQAVPGPSTWGGSAVAGSFNTGVQATSVKYDPVNNVIWAANFANNTVSRLKPDGTVLGTYPTSPSPNELAIDSAGNCWVACNGRVNKLSPTGALLVNVAIPGALWPQPDAAGNCWVTAGNRVYKLDPNGNVLPGFPITINGSFSITVDAAGNAWITSTATNPGRVYKVSPTGTTLATISVGRYPAYISLDPVTGDAWVANYQSASVSVINTTTNTVSATHTVPSSPWCVAIDATGTPWTSHISPGAQVVEKLNPSTGAVVSTFNMTTGNPYEMTFDSSGVAWVCTDSGLVTIVDLGNLADIFGADYLGTPSDGDDSYGFLKFKIPANAFGNFAAIGSTLNLTANSTSATGEDVGVFAASAYVGGSTGTLWQGYAGTPNVNETNRPGVLTPEFTSKTGLAILSNTSYAFNVPLPSDQLNTTDPTNAEWAYATRSHNKKLSTVAHWYSNKSAGATTAYYPTLKVTLATGAKFGAAGLASQPTLDSLNHKVWVLGTNALFELDYSSPNAFEDPSKTYFNLTQTGRTAGPTTSGASKTYIYPFGNLLVAENGRLVAPDLNPATNQMFLNDFNINLPPAGDRLAYQLNVNPGVGSIGQAMIYDYTSGSAYLTTSNNYVIRASILQ